MDPKSFLKTLVIIHLALCTGLGAFILFCYFQSPNVVADLDNNDILIYIVPFFAVTGYFMSQILFKKQLESIQKNSPLQSKLAAFQTASLLKYALLEAPAFLAAFAFLNSNTALHFVIAIALLIYLYTQRPTKEKLLKEVPLNMEERKHFNAF